MAAGQQELRSQFEQLTTEELTAILQSRDMDVWRPEVFGIVRAVLLSRGVFSVPPAPPHAGSDKGGASASRVVAPREGWQEIANTLDLGRADDADKLLTGVDVPVQVIQDRPLSFSIHVPKEHAESAWKQLRSAGIIPSENPPEAITLTGGSCPACGASVPPEAGECPACGLAV